MVVSGKQRATGNAAGDMVQHCVRDAVTIERAGAAAELVQHDQAVAGCMLHGTISLFTHPPKQSRHLQAAASRCGLQGTRDKIICCVTAADVCSTAWPMLPVSQRLWQDLGSKAVRRSCCSCKLSTVRGGNHTRWQPARCKQQSSTAKLCRSGKGLSHKQVHSSPPGYCRLHTAQDGDQSLAWPHAGQAVVAAGNSLHGPGQAKQPTKRIAQQGTPLVLPGLDAHLQNRACLRTLHHKC